MKRPDLPRLLDRDLEKLFAEHFFDDDSNWAENVRSFIDLLWTLRVMFDQHMIKWADQGEVEIHLISSLSLSTNNGKRYMSRARGWTPTEDFRFCRACSTTLKRSRHSTG